MKPGQSLLYSTTVLYDIAVAEVPLLAMVHIYIYTEESVSKDTKNFLGKLL